MNITIPYGTETADLRLPSDVDVEFLRAESTPPAANAEDALTAALAKPVGAPAPAATLTPSSSVVVLVADITRAKGTEKLLPLLVRYLTNAGVEAGAITVLVARGAHRKLTKAEKDFLKSSGMGGVRIEEHDCDNAAALSALLLTRRGTPVRTNKALRDVDCIILLSPISFHYFAGYGGGRKLVLPGSADRASIVANHRLSLVDSDPVTLHPACRAGNLEGNPVHEDMCETLSALDGVFGINFFADAKGDVLFVNAGEPIRAHAEACENYKRVYLRRVDDPFGVMVLSAGGFPYDINLVQAHKAIRHTAGAMKDGGSILYFAQCEEGVGSESLQKALRMDRGKFLKTAQKQYDLNNTTAVSLHELGERFDIGVVSTVSVDVLLACGMKPCLNAEGFISRALDKQVTNRVGVITHGSTLLPQA
jgi:nickel-dependent lactate racemase